MRIFYFVWQFNRFVVPIRPDGNAVLETLQRRHRRPQLFCKFYKRKW